MTPDQIEEGFSKSFPPNEDRFDSPIQAMIAFKAGVEFAEKSVIAKHSLTEEEAKEFRTLKARWKQLVSTEGQNWIPVTFDGDNYIIPDGYAPLIRTSAQIALSIDEDYDLREKNKEELKEAIELLQEIANQCDHQIPLYAYGDNEAACQMSTILQQTQMEIGNVISRIKEIL